MNETLKTIFSRKSVRTLSDQPISNEIIDLIIKAGMAAPSAVDKRPWEFIIITQRPLLKQLSDVLPYAKMTESASIGMVIAGDLTKQAGNMKSDYWIMDCSAVAENILLAVESLGLGAVWTAVYPNKDRVDNVRKILNLPEHIIPLCLIPIGTPAGEEQPKNKYNPKQIHWNKW